MAGGLDIVMNYKLNRPLTPAEREAKLDIKKQYSKTPHYNLSLLKINSTYVESVDRQYQDRGFIAIGMAIGFSALLWTFVYAGYHAGWIGWLLCIPAMLVPAFLFFKDAFNYTHYPIRFNRKNRMVYVWQQDGAVLKAPWDRTYFTIMRNKEKGIISHKFVAGHLLAEDKKTVTDTYGLALYVTNFDSDEELKKLFEFYRLYMEEGPETAVKAVGEVPLYCLPPLDQKRESFGFSYVIRALHFHATPILNVIMLPYILLFTIGRWIAMQTSTIPKWPEWVEAECAIDADDPHAYDHSTNTTNIWGEPLDKE